MEDIDSRFIYALLKAQRHEQSKFYAKQIPKGIFQIRPTEIDWIYQHRERFGVYPSYSAYVHRYGPLAKHTDPLAATLQAVLDFEMFEQMRKVQTEVKTLLDKSGDVIKAMRLFKEGASRLTDYSVEYVDVDFSQSTEAVARYRDTVKLLNSPHQSVIDSPWPTLNKLIGFLRPGDVVILASRTSLGKTWVTCDWAKFLASKRNVPTMYISAEMMASTLGDRFEALQFELPYEALRSGTLKGRQLRQWLHRRKNFKGTPLTICGAESFEGLWLGHVDSRIQQYRPHVVFIDGAYKLRVQGVSRNANQVEALSTLSSQLNALAKRQSVPIIASVQLGRRSENAKTGITQGSLVDIYNCDAWAQDADFVLLMGGRRGANSRLLSLAKGRDTAVGEFHVNFQLDPFPRFTELHGGAASNPNQSASTVSFTGIK